MRTIPITTRALIQRLQRALAKEGKTLRRTRGAHAASVGAWFIVNDRDHVVGPQIGDLRDLESYGREMKVLEDYEHVEEAP